MDNLYFINSNDDEGKKIAKLTKELKYNYGCNINHELFWESLAPIEEIGGLAPMSDSNLGKEIDKAFGSFDDFVS